MTALGPRWAARAERYDREASFPFDNYADLREAVMDVAAQDDERISRESNEGGR